MSEPKISFGERGAEELFETQLEKAPDALERWMKLGRSGVLVSVVYGPCGVRGAVGFSVNCMNTATLEQFEHAFAAASFDQAIDIAEKECCARRWLAN